MIKIRILIERSKDLYCASSIDLDCIFAAGDTLEEAKKDVYDVINIVKTEYPDDRIPKELKEDFEIEWVYDFSSFAEYYIKYVESKNEQEREQWLSHHFGEKETIERQSFDKKLQMLQVGIIIKKARKSEKITQSELADRVQSTKSYISRIEHGTVDISVGLFFKILTALGMQVNITKKEYEN